MRGHIGARHCWAPALTRRACCSGSRDGPVSTRGSQIGKGNHALTKSSMEQSKVVSRWIGFAAGKGSEEELSWRATVGHRRSRKFYFLDWDPRARRPALPRIFFGGKPTPATHFRLFHGALVDAVIPLSYLLNPRVETAHPWNRSQQARRVNASPAVPCTNMSPHSLAVRKNSANGAPEL